MRILVQVCEFRHVFIILGPACTVANGKAGDGTTQGTCHSGGLCQADGKCKGRFCVFQVILVLKFLTIILYINLFWMYLPFPISL